MWRTFLSPDNGSSEPNNISALLDKCPPHYQIYPTVWAVTQLLSSAVSFPASMAVLWEIVYRHRPSAQRGHSWSSHLSVSPDLLIINFILVAIVNCTEQVLSIINSLQDGSHLLQTQVIKAMSAFILNAGPPSMLSICLDCYLAVVHPLKYTLLRTTWRHPLLLTVLICLYTITTETIIIVLQLPPYNYIGIITFYVALPAVIFLNVSTLRALWLAGPGRRSLTSLGPTKRRAFWVVLTVLLSSLIYCLPQVVLHTYWAVIRVRHVRFRCVWYPMVMLVPTITTAVISLQFAYRSKHL